MTVAPNPSRDPIQPEPATAPPLTRPGRPVLERHRRARHPAVRPTALAVGIVFAWAGTLWAAPRVQVGPSLHQLALFGHLAALVLGFGAALTVEWFGLLWLLRRRPLSAVIQTAQGAHLPIWLGLLGLAISGIVLTPERLSTAATVKLVVVLVVALNGLYAQRLQRQLDAVGPSTSRPVMARAAGAALISQSGWWTATAIGFFANQG